MNFRFSRAPPQGVSAHARLDDRHSIRWTLPGRTTYLLARAGGALDAVEGAGNALYLGVRRLKRTPRVRSSVGQSFQNPSKRSERSSVYRTVCVMLRWPR